MPMDVNAGASSPHGDCSGDSSTEKSPPRSCYRFPSHSRRDAIATEASVIRSVRHGASTGGVSIVPSDASSILCSQSRSAPVSAPNTSGADYLACSWPKPTVDADSRSHATPSKSLTGGSTTVRNLQDQVGLSAGVVLSDSPFTPLPSGRSIPSPTTNSAPIALCRSTPFVEHVPYPHPTPNSLDVAARDNEGKAAALNLRYSKYQRLDNEQRVGTSRLYSADCHTPSAQLGSYDAAALSGQNADDEHRRRREHNGRQIEGRGSILRDELQTASGATIVRNATPGRTARVQDSRILETPREAHSYAPDVEAVPSLVSRATVSQENHCQDNGCLDGSTADEILTELSRTSISCSFCNSEQNTDAESSRKRPMYSEDKRSDKARRWLSVKLSSISASSGHGGLEVKKTVPALVSDLVNLTDVGERLNCCSLCATMFDKVEKRSRRTASDADKAVAAFYRRRDRPEKPTTCYFCDRVEEKTGWRPPVESSSQTKIGFDFRFRYLDPESSSFRSVSEALAFRLSLPLSVCAHFVRNTDTLGACNRHKQVNRHVQHSLTFISSTCIVPDCGAVINLKVLRAPENGDLSVIEDALYSAFDSSLAVSDVLDHKLCAEHYALLTRAPRNSRTSLACLIADMQLYRGQAVSAFVISLLQAFGIDVSSSNSAALLPTALDKDFPRPVHGVIYFKVLFDYLLKDTEQNKMDRRTLFSILVSALAPFGVHTDKDSHNGFIYFYRQQLVIEEIRSSESTSEGLSASFIRPLHSDKERQELARLGTVFKEARCELLAGRMNLRDIVLAISPWYWVYNAWTLASGRQRESWIRTAKSMKLAKPTGIWPCANLDEIMPRGDILATLVPSSVRLVRRVLTEIERRVTILTGIYGPIGTGVGALVHMKGSKALQVSLSRLGLCCTYSEMLKIRGMFTSQRNAHPAKAFASIPPNSLVCMSLDNADFSLPNSIDVCGKNTSGEHLTFASVHAMQIPPTHADRPPHLMAFKDTLIQFPNREEFVSNFVTKHDDPDLVAYGTVLLGRVWQMRERLQSKNPKDQISLRHLLFSSIEVFPAQNSVVIFAKLEDFKASDANELLRVIEDAVLEMLPGQPGRYELLGVSGDFPVLWIVWKEWVKRLALLRSEGKELKWFPFPSGAAFHDLKVGALPTLKMLMEGALVEDLIKNGRAGLSNWYCNNWNLVGNLRKNRRVNDSVIVASILSVVPTLRAEDPELDAALDKQYEDSADDVQGTISKSGSKLRVTQAVTRKAFEDGAAIRKSILQFCGKHRNAAFYLGLVLLDLLIPTTALQILSRCGQTSIYQKFYFNLSPFILQTTKSSYQKHSVMTMHILAVLPDCVVADIFGGAPGAMVVNPGRNPYANLPQDETTEMGIGDVKGLPIRRKEPLLKSVTWCGEVSRIAKALQSAMKLEGQPGSVFQSKEERQWDKDGILTTFDKEHGGATNASVYCIC